MPIAVLLTLIKHNCTLIPEIKHKTRRRSWESISPPSRVI